MSEGLTMWWQGRSLREQRLLIVMSVLIAVVIGWLLIVRPLSDALDEAKRRHGEAIVALADARARAEAAGQVQGRPAVAAPLPIDSLITRTASEAGFANARVTAQGPSAAIVAIEAGRPQALFTWLSVLEGQGVRVRLLRARVNPDRTLTFEATLGAGEGR